MSGPRPSDLATCVQCGLCLSACPTFRLTGMEGYSPRGRIAAVRATKDLHEAPAIVQDFVDTCLGCRACEAACPSGVPYGRILEDARAAMPRPGGVRRRLTESVLLWSVGRRWRLSVLSLVLYPLQKLGLLAAAARLARRGWLPAQLEAVVGIPRLRLRTLLVRMSTNYAPAGDQRGSVVLFTGCVQDAWSRDVHWATITALTRTGMRVRQPHGQVCCGALHAHSGLAAGAARLARRNLDPLERYDGAIVVNSAGCAAKLGEYDHVIGDERGAAVAARITDVTEVIDPALVRSSGARPPAGLERIAVHDPCHLHFVRGVRDAPRELLRACGYEIVELGDGGRCCGAAGSYAAAHPGWAKPLRDAKMQACADAAADAVAVGNPGCSYWMASAPGAPRLYHPIQLVAMALVAGGRSDGA